MKLRIGGNSIRLRVLRSEVESLRSGKRLEEALVFSPAARLTYVVETDATAHAATASFANESILVRLPHARVQQWADGDAVGIYDEQDCGSGQPLEILVEKDFACLDRSDAENLDTFENPNATC